MSTIFENSEDVRTQIGTVNIIGTNVPRNHAALWQKWSPSQGNQLCVGLRPTNTLFVGRGSVLQEIKKTINDGFDGSTISDAVRIVITGIGGQGKSEICLRVANDLRSKFWGVFWIDVSTPVTAKSAFTKLAKQLSQPAETVEDVLQVLDNISDPWLLILDNADDPNHDFQQYFPSSNNGCVLMTSRNTDCQVYATISFELGGLDLVNARQLLLKSAKIHKDLWQYNQAAADRICSLLDSHPLALIQAGSYVAQRYCTLDQYPDEFNLKHALLLKEQPRQARSRYGSLFATFESSITAIKTLEKEDGEDVRELLSMLSMLASASLPLSIFENAWRGARDVVSISEETDPEDTPWERVEKLYSWHAERLIAAIPIHCNQWSSYRLIKALNFLRTLALVSLDEEAHNTYIRMHPLAHGWAKDRQDVEQQNQSRIAAVCLLIFAVRNGNFLAQQQLLLRIHALALLEIDISDMYKYQSQPQVTTILFWLTDLLDWLRLDKKQSSVSLAILNYLGFSPDHPDISYLPLWNGIVRAHGYNNKANKQLDILQKIVDIKRETLAAEHTDRLSSQRDLGVVYLEVGQIPKAVTMLEELIRIKEQIPNAEDCDLDWLHLQYDLGQAYYSNKQIDETIKILEEVVKVDERLLILEHPNRLASQALLGKAYLRNGRTQDAFKIFEQIAEVERRVLSVEHPHRLATQYCLGEAYLNNGQSHEAIAVLEEIVKVEGRILSVEDGDRLMSQHLLATAYWAAGYGSEALQLMSTVVKVRQRVCAEDDTKRLASEDCLELYQDHLSLKSELSVTTEQGKVTGQDTELPES